MRELLVSLGHAVAGLAEEQRNTQRRLAVVEEGRSGSSSSMRTGREGVEAELVQVEMSELSSATQYFCIGGSEQGVIPGSGSGPLTMEDWVQQPVRIRDIPREGTSEGILGVPEYYGPGVDAVSQEAISAQAGARLDLLDLVSPSAQVQGEGSSMPGSEVRFGTSAQEQVQPRRCQVRRSGSALRPRHQVQPRRCQARRSGSALRPKHQVQPRQHQVRRSGFGPSAQVQGAGSLRPGSEVRFGTSAQAPGEASSAPSSEVRLAQVQGAGSLRPGSEVRFGTSAKAPGAASSAPGSEVRFGPSAQVQSANFRGSARRLGSDPLRRCQA